MIIILKCESADELRLVADVLDAAHSPDEAIPMVELARAMFVVDCIALTYERVYELFFEACDLGAEGSWESLLFPRSHIVAAAATSDIAALDVPYWKRDQESVKREPTANRKLGMTGKDPLHAAQLAVITRSSLHRRMPNATPLRLWPRRNAGRLGVTSRSARHQTRGAAVKLSEFEPKVDNSHHLCPHAAPVRIRPHDEEHLQG